MSQNPQVLDPRPSFCDVEDNSYLHLTSPASPDTSDPTPRTRTSKPHARLYCDIEACKSTFRRKADFIRHKKSIHGPKSACPYDGCRYTTGRSDKLREHTTSMHGSRNQDPQESLDPGDGGPHTSPTSFPRPPMHSDTSNANDLDMLLSSSQPPSQCSGTTSMNFPSSYSGSTIFDPWSFNDTGTLTSNSTLSSIDVQGTDTLEQLFNQPSDFYGIGNWANDELFHNLSSSTGTCFDSNAWADMPTSFDI